MTDSADGDKGRTDGELAREPTEMNGVKACGELKASPAFT
jgi:hypothetical protein